jgi:phenylalanyl-tRNA synthetase beta subunit
MTDLMLVSSLLAHPYRTLTTKEVNEHHAEIAELCKSKFGVEIR